DRHHRVPAPRRRPLPPRPRPARQAGGTGARISRRLRRRGWGRPDPARQRGGGRGGHDAVRQPGLRRVRGNLEPDPDRVRRHRRDRRHRPAPRRGAGDGRGAQRHRPLALPQSGGGRRVRGGDPRRVRRDRDPARHRRRPAGGRRGDPRRPGGRGRDPLRRRHPWRRQRRYPRVGSGSGQRPAARRTRHRGHVDPAPRHRRAAVPRDPGPRDPNRAAGDVDPAARRRCPHPPQRVYARRHGRHDGSHRGGAGAGRHRDRARSARQPRRLGRRGARRLRSVRAQRHGALPATGSRSGAVPGGDLRRRHRPRSAADGAGQRRFGLGGGDRWRGAARQRPGDAARRDHLRHRHRADPVRAGGRFGRPARHLALADGQRGTCLADRRRAGSPGRVAPRRLPGAADRRRGRRRFGRGVGIVRGSAIAKRPPGRGAAGRRGTGRL
ncbi:MAG: Carboxyl-terminal protease, partial [uncultured Thermomicrobiales bacterium]